jgi:MFS family permease
MPYFSSVGISRTFSSTVVLIMAIISIGGRVGSGWLGDKFNTRRIYLVSFGLMAVGTLFFAYIVQGNMLMIILFILFYGLGSAGNVTLRPVILRKYFHNAKFGARLGIADAFMMVGQAGAPLAGWVYDVWGSYRGIWLVYVGVIVLGTILVMTLPKSPAIPEVKTKTAAG